MVDMHCPEVLVVKVKFWLSRRAAESLYGVGPRQGSQALYWQQTHPCALRAGRYRVCT